MTLDSAAARANVISPAGAVIAIPEGDRIVFGRGPDADLVIQAGRGLSRRAGVIAAVAGGVWVANISRTHALYAEGDGYRVRLPRMDEAGEPAAATEPSKGWFLRAGTALVGSRTMLDEGQPLRLVVAAQATPADSSAVHSSPASGDVTLLPFYLDPNTKLFLVALLWCRPWLVDPARSTPLPRTPEIARGALMVTDAHHELDLFDTDPAFRDRLSARVGEHLKVLRRKLTERSLVRPGMRLSDEVAVGALIENGIITGSDLDKIDDPAWCSRQEDLWWTPVL
ncbi:MAG TPA: FHA domain-containing protein [Streptosporangiaceae bacterium]|nr:FHA domain-containing protein [Streptosporangiaceae bacterium]